jgi:HSP20 family molecular chaperone IbpA
MSPFENLHPIFRDIFETAWGLPTSKDGKDFISIPLPGVGKENINVKHTNNLLTISYKDRDTKEEKFINCYINRKKVKSAKYVDGMLNINLEKYEDASTIKVQIE